jgi:hypothetical protein
MSLLSMLAETATVYTPQFDETDAYGDILTGTETSATYPACFEQLSSDEIVRDRDTIVADWKVVLPATASIGPFARIESSGRQFKVWGDPIEARTPQGIHHLEIRLRRVT